MGMLNEKSIREFQGTKEKSNRDLKTEMGWQKKKKSECS